MKTLTKFFAVAALAITSLSLAADFPKGSPKFEHSLSDALAAAKTNGKPIVAVFSAVWCGPCQSMKKDVYPSPEVTAYHDKFNWAYLDTDDNSNEKDAKKYGVSGIPHIQFLNAQGKPIDKQVGSSPAADFAKTLEGVLKKAAK